MKKHRTAILGLAVMTGTMSLSWAAGGPPKVNTSKEQLGMLLYKDKNLSSTGVQSCQTCHHPYAGFADRTNLMHPEVNVVSTGADGVSQGGRDAPSSAYAGFSPIMSIDEGGEYVGGLFWDGRATGERLGDPLAEQAQGPPLNPVEMGLETSEQAIDIIRESDYSDKWLAVFGPNSLDDVDMAWVYFGRAIAAYERSADVTQFSSKYDLAKDQFTDAEARGETLFQNNCARCHSNTPEFGAPAPLFTNYHYANIGVPSNPLVPLSSPDLGLGEITSDSLQDGKFKIPTLRNIGMTAPYSHNGRFATLIDMVSFINDSSAFTPEVDRNIDGQVGNMSLTDQDISDLVSFLLTLTDGYE